MCEDYSLINVKGLDTCYGIAYMSQTQEQQRFTISEVAVDWHELMIPRANAQYGDRRCSKQTYHRRTFGINPVANIR